MCLLLRPLLGYVLLNLLAVSNFVRLPGTFCPGDLASSPVVPSSSSWLTVKQARCKPGLVKSTSSLFSSTFLMLYLLSLQNTQSSCIVRAVSLWILMRSVWRLKQRPTDSRAPTRASLRSPSTSVSILLMVKLSLRASSVASSNVILTFATCFSLK